MSTKISRVHLQEFTVFSDLDLQIAEGINVIAGENGAGKSHLLKAIYSVVSADESSRGSQ